MDKGFRKAPLAFCRKLCYADRGATSSTPVGGSPGFLGGYTSLPPIERKGAVRRTANLINDCQWQSHLAPHSCGASWRDKKGPPEGHPAQIFDKAFDKRRPAGVWQKSTGLPHLIVRVPSGTIKKQVVPFGDDLLFGTAELTKSEPFSFSARAVSISLSVMVWAPSLWLKAMISLSS